MFARLIDDFDAWSMLTNIIVIYLLPLTEFGFKFINYLLIANYHIR